MKEKDSLSEKLHDFAEKVETDIREHEEKHREAEHKRDKEIEHEKKMFEKRSTVAEANMMALADEDIVTDD